MAKAYKSRYIPMNPEKYEGKNLDRIVCRSNWERHVCKWADMAPEIKTWSSESVFIPYKSHADVGRRLHYYIVDFKLTFQSGKIYLVEVKPEKQTKAPKFKTAKTMNQIEQLRTWNKNRSKWAAAHQFCQRKGWIFKLWTEAHLQTYGISPGCGKWH